MWECDNFTDEFEVMNITYMGKSELSLTQLSFSLYSTALMCGIAL
jgi:hypothetical protein